MSFTCSSCVTNSQTGVTTCTYTTKTWALYFLNCPNNNTTNCNSSVSAYLPAITRCLQSL
jgi:hypothetical protein